MPARDARGRWVRRDVVAKADTGAQQLKLDSDDVADAAGGGSDFAAGSRITAIGLAEAGTDLLATVVESHPKSAPIRRRLPSPPFLLFGAALGFVAVLFVFQSGYFSTNRSDATPSLNPATITAPAKVPVDSAQAAQPPATRAVAVPELRKARKTGAPPASLPEPAAAVPPPPFRSESVPAAIVPVQATTDEDGWFKLAEKHLQQGDDKRAEELYRRLLNEGSQQGRAALALGDLFARKNDFSRAQEFYRASTRLFQYSAQQASPQ